MNPSSRPFGPALVLLLVIGASAATAQVIDPARGADPTFDYASLQRIAPWDDRNYQLTAEDVAALGPNEQEATEAIPAFYRVYLRRNWTFRTEGPAQYPRSALPGFLNEYGGYLYQGNVYREAVHGEDGWSLRLEEGVPEAELMAQKFLAGESRVTDPNSAAESAIAINPADPDVVIAGSNGPGGGQRMHFSTDGGETWSLSTTTLPGSCCDPTVGWSSDGSIGYTSTLNLPELIFYRTLDGGQTWTDSVQVDNDSGFVDKQYLHVDRHPSSPHLDHLYHTWHESNVMKFSRSTDFGVSWSAEQTIGSSAGIGSDITTDKAGNVYYFWPAFGPRDILVAKSTDGGASFGRQSLVVDTEGGFDFPLPSMENRRVFIYNAADADLSNGPFGGSVYVSWTDNTGPDSGTPANNHGRIQVAYSRDGGATWTVRTPHETADSDTVDRYHQWLGVAPDGRVHVIFYDTRRDLPNRNQVDVFRSFSTDGGDTWSTPERVTAEQSPNISGSFEFGDYNGLDVVGNDVIAIYTDNRDE
ncbi:MAG: sialidase family protein, partial [Thermoanaerobaculia bacterium]